MAGAFLWDDKVRGASLSLAAGTVAALMPLSNLTDAQPRQRTRWIGSSGSVIVDFGADTAIDAVALLSTTLRAADTVRLVLENAANVFIFDSGYLAADTIVAAQGNIVRISTITLTIRYVHVFFDAPGATFVDIGRIVAGPVWRLSRAFAYGVQEGREILDQRDRNPLTGAEFPRPALVNPRVTRFTLPLLANAEIRTEHRSMLAALGGAGEALWIPEITLDPTEINSRSLWGAIASPGEESMSVRDTPAGNARTFRIVERT